MAIKITDACINCGACEPECPNTAIYEGGMPWNMSEGTSIKGGINLMSGEKIDADTNIEAISDEFYYISPDKCTECVGFHEEPQCAAVCPVDCCVPNEKIEEEESTLILKQKKLHP
jgi:ferredoxin